MDFHSNQHVKEARRRERPSCTWKYSVSRRAMCVDRAGAPGIGSSPGGHPASPPQQAAGSGRSLSLSHT